MVRNKKIIIVGGIILVIGISVFAFLYQFSAPQKGVETEKITINLTTTEEDLIPKLKEQGYIRSDWAFNFVLKVKGWQGKIEPGGYNVSKSMNAWELADTLSNHPYQKWVVIPEGLRKEEVAEMVQEKLGWPEVEERKFLSWAKEGYLFPDTYLLNIDYTGEEAAKRMESQFNEKAGKALQEFTEANIRHDTAITLASIIQREAASEEEMPLIAGIIWNRLLKPMPLEIDATIQYVVGESGKWWRPVTPEEYKIESPYNTYLHKGRPPTPICNPGLAAINAVINSEDSEYLYYLHDSEGQIHTAITYEEHLKNIIEYFWNVYTDEELGYEMKYPPTWSIAEERRDFGIELARVVFQSKDYKLEESEEYKEVVARGEETGLLPEMVLTEGVGLSLVITEIPSDFKWRDWAERATDYPYGKIVSEKFLTLEGKEIYERQTESGETASIVISFSSQEETKLFELILHTLKKDKEKNLEIPRQILSTFQFFIPTGADLP
ncbi:MAG: endolytic transglycosylase MltG [bacterium]